MTHFRSPLQAAVLKVLEKKGVVDITDVILALGACSSPVKGVNAYRIVASDILGCLASDGLLTRFDRGNGNSKKPEDGGFVWRKSADFEATKHKLDEEDSIREAREAQHATAMGWS